MSPAPAVVLAAAAQASASALGAALDRIWGFGVLVFKDLGP